jgi:ribosomal protein L11 methyltransferase
MQWRRFSLRVLPSETEVASALLAAAGNAHAAIADSAVSIYVPLRRSKRVAARLAKALALARREKVLSRGRASSALVGDEDWANAWKRHYRPAQLADGLFVAPSWLPNFEPPNGARLIRLDPGMAFGTGLHATTQMALQLMLPYVKAGAPLLDIGCGSGILGIAAAQLGAKVYAVDLDPIAAGVARKNFRQNRVRASSVLVADGVPQRFPRAALVVANITAEVLAPLAPAFRRKLLPGGRLVISGITHRGRKSVSSAFARAGLRLSEERRRGKWIARLYTAARNAR